jgi:hypothetical protein
MNIGIWGSGNRDRGVGGGRDQNVVDGFVRMKGQVSISKTGSKLLPLVQVAHLTLSTGCTYYGVCPDQNPIQQKLRLGPDPLKENLT